MILFMFSVDNLLGHSFLALEAMDKVVKKDAESLGKEMGLKVQELLQKEFRHKDEGVLPKEKIKNLLISSNRVMDYVLSLELQVIKLKQYALHIFNAAITGTTCNKFLDIFEVTYSYPKSLESHQQGMSLATFNYSPSTSETDPTEDKLLANDEMKQSAELASVFKVDPSMVDSITTK